jgi:hypothetical protein
VTSIRMEDLGFESWQRQSIFIWVSFSLLFNTHWCSFPREADNSAPSRIELKTERSCTFAPPTGPHGVDRDNFTVTFSDVHCYCVCLLHQHNTVQLLIQHIWLLSLTCRTKRSRCRDQATHRMTGSIPGGERDISVYRTPRPVLEYAQLPSQLVPGPLYSWTKKWGLNLTTHLHLVPVLRRSRAWTPIRPLPLTP